MTAEHDQRQERGAACPQYLMQDPVAAGRRPTGARRGVPGRVPRRTGSGWKIPPPISPAPVISSSAGAPPACRGPLGRARRSPGRGRGPAASPVTMKLALCNPSPTGPSSSKAGGVVGQAETRPGSAPGPAPRPTNRGPGDRTARQQALRVPGSLRPGPGVGGMASRPQGLARAGSNRR